MPETILLVEDEMRIARWTQTYIEKAGYTCIWAGNGQDGLQTAQHQKVDLVVLDIMLPEIDGWTVCQRIRERSDVPIIMLTARITDEDKINGLRMGADDYVTKPFNPHELVARIEANLRRANGSMGPQRALCSGSLRLEIDSKQCYVNEVPVALTAGQFHLLEFFMRHPEQALTREQIIENVFGIDHDSYDRSIDVHIRRLRTRIEQDPSNPQLIQTVFGIGYRFCPE